MRHVLVLFLLAGCTVVRPSLGEPSPATLAAVRAVAPHPCNRTTAAALDALGLAGTPIRSLLYDRRVSGTEHTYLQGYDAWIDLEGRPGNLVLQLNPYCRLDSALGRAGFVLPPPARGRA